VKEGEKFMENKIKHSEKKTGKEKKERKL